MSYCRWSTDDFQCDLYVYADVNGGYTTHIAKYRYKFKEPLPEIIPFSAEHIPAFVAREAEIMRMIDTAEMELITLPQAGESFNLDKEQTIAKLEELQKLGYRFPADVIDAIREEEENE